MMRQTSRPTSLWVAFMAAVRDIVNAVRRMSPWVYLLLFFCAAVANFIATVVVR